MVREIVLYGDPVLREKCAPVEEVTDELRQLTDDMIETMRAAEGVGLAAPQIGIPIQLAVIDVSHDPECITYLRVDGQDAALDDIMPLIFFNPDLDSGKKKVAEPEGCLSFPDMRADIARPPEVRAKLQLLDGRTVEIETDGLLARAIRHETDHLNGILFIDRMSTAAKLKFRRQLRYMQEEWKEKEKQKAKLA